jgi:hypothetical protein
MNCIGQAGKVVCLRNAATQILLATYAEPCDGRLFHIVPGLHTLHAPNDSDPYWLTSTRGYFDPRTRIWIRQ